MAFSDRLPSKVTLGPMELRLIVKSDIKGESGSLCWGMFNGDTNEVHLHAQLQEGPFAVTIVLHELIHAGLWLYNSTYDNEEEVLCHSISAFLTCLLRDNPELTAWISEQVNLPHQK